MKISAIEKFLDIAMISFIVLSVIAMLITIMLFYQAKNARQSQYRLTKMIRSIPPTTLGPIQNQLPWHNPP